MSGLRGFFISGADTDAGKTTLTAALLRAFLLHGSKALAIKPVQTGVLGDDDPECDTCRYAMAVADVTAERCWQTLRHFPLPASPHLAAAAEGASLQVQDVAAAVRKAACGHSPVLVEGAGGLLVPLNWHAASATMGQAQACTDFGGETMLDLAQHLGLPVIIAAADKLGVINHVLLSIAALRACAVPVAGIVLVRTAPEPQQEHARLVQQENSRVLTDVAPLAVLPYEPALAAQGSVPLGNAAVWQRMAQVLQPFVEKLLTQLALAPAGTTKPAALAHSGLPQACAEPFSSTAAAFSCTMPAGTAYGSAHTPSFRGGKPSATVGADLVPPHVVPARTQHSAPQGAVPHAARLPELSPQALLDFDQKHLWHPYTSAIQPLPVYEVLSAQGNRLRLRDGRELIDGMSSWWCALHGYGHPRLVQALQQQAASMPHVMFGGITHRPAVDLARVLLPLLPRGLERIFYADSGSVAVEVALKMALQYWQAQGHSKRTKVLVPRGGYHGDTVGAMSVCDPINGMHSLFTGLLPQQIFIERPSCRFDQPFDPASVAAVEQAFAQHGSELAAFIVEPVVQGAGGMYFYHPEYLRRVAALCRRYDVLLILDEIATGFGRTGTMFAAEWADIQPDILCGGKALTGGTMTFSFAACTQRVAEGICAGGNVFMHGPTFMANPLACAVALASLTALLDSNWQAAVAGIEAGLQQGLAPCRALHGVKDVRVLGAIGVVELEQPVDMAALQAFFVQRGVWIRPFGRLVYVMPPYISPPQDIACLCAAVVEAIAGKHYRAV